MDTPPEQDAPSRRGSGTERPSWRPVADQWVLALGFAALAAVLVRFRQGVDADAWLHLRIGRELLSGRHFGTLPDPMTVLADRAYVPTQWLSEIVGVLVHDVAGVVGWRILRIVALLVTLAAVYATARRWVGPARATGILAVVGLATSAAWAERPQMAGLALAALSVLLWSGTVLDGRPRWSLVPVTWLWAMLHGTWAVGLAFAAVLVVVSAVTRPAGLRRRATLAVFAACVGVVALTPLGPRLLVEPFAVTASARPGVNEWQRPTPDNPVFVLALVAALVVLVRAARRRPVPWGAVLLAVAAAAVVAYSVRTVAFGALLLAPALALAFREDPAPTRTRRELVPLGAAAVVLALVPGVVWGGPSSGPLGPPVDAALSAMPPGTEVAVDVGVSGWVLAAHPGIRPLRDLRAEVYTQPVAEAYEILAKGRQGWQGYADREGVTVVLAVVDERLDREIAADGGWNAVATDGRYRIWRR